MKKNIKNMLAICMSVVILISTFGNFFAVAEESADKQSVLDRCSLQMANDSKDSYLAAIESFAQLAEENIDVVLEITDRTNVAKFCGNSFTHVTLSLINPKEWFDVAKDGAKYTFLNALTIATINYGIEYCEQGAMYFDKMQTIYDKYNGGEVTDPADARDIIKYRFYAARCYLYGFEFMMPFIEGYLESGGVSGILIESMGEEAFDAFASTIMKDVYDMEVLEKLWSGIMDGSENLDELLDSLVFSITEDKKLVFDDIDAMIAKLEGDPPENDEEVDFSEETDPEYDGELVELIDKIIYQSSNPYYTEWKDNIVLTKDTVISNLKITDGSVNLNGYELTVLGNLIHANGEIYCRKGTLHVTGDYRILTEKTDEFGDKKYTPSKGTLYMKYEEDVVDVDGGFYVCNNEIGGIGVKASAGTMRVSGAFEILDYNDLDCSGTHKVIFDGSGEQKIDIDSGSNSINQLYIYNENPVFSGQVNIATLMTDSVIRSDGFGFQNMNLNGHNLKVIGNVSSHSALELNEANLEIEGNFIQPSGTVRCNKGTLHVTGDYRILTEKTDEFGDKKYTPSKGTLYMKYEEDVVDVDGGFYVCNNEIGGIAVKGSAGTMRVGGIFEILDYNDLSCSGTHKVILDGDEKQTITMSGTKFNILQLTKDYDDGYEFEYVPCWSEIIYCDSEPGTDEPTTEESTTGEPTTKEPETEVPTTEPTTKEPETQAPTTEPITKEPETEIPTTEPTTKEPETESTTKEPETQAPTTEPITKEPETEVPTTKEPVTDAPTTGKPVEKPTEKPTQKPVLDKLEVSGDTVKVDNTSKVSTVKTKSSAADIIKSVKNEKVSIVDKDGKAVSGDALVGTGAKIQIKDNSGKVINTYTVCVPTDVDGNGKTTAADARLALRGSAKLDKIEGVYATASDMNSDGKITAADARKILRISAGLEAA